MSAKNRPHYRLSFLVFTLLASGSSWVCSADDSAGGLDMNALASLASTLGNNPQIMGMVSGLFNQNSAKTPSSSSSGASGFDAAAAAASTSASAGSSDQDVSQLADVAAGMSQAPRSPVQQARAAALAPTTTSTGGGSSLSGLMSLLPALTQGAPKTPPVAPPPAAVPVQPQPMIGAAPTAAAGASTPAAGGGGNPAQAVINQVLTAYASGQIPPEMIQLGLSGRVPPQIMELALSGQVPPQIIQMVISGQIPMSTINAFLSTMQAAPRTVSTSATAAASDAAPSTGGTFGGSGGGGIISSTRALVEALFKPSVNGGRKIIVPTLLGPVPIQIPTLPSVKQFGKMVGSSISNMASMVPF